LPVDENVLGCDPEGVTVGLNTGDNGGVGVVVRAA
jgi:hypothetical protein